MFRVISGPALIAALVLTAITTLLLSSAVAAARPSKEFLPPPDGLLDSSSCGYEILVTFPVQQEYITTYFDREGNVTKQIVTGRLVVTFTNTATDESLTTNISGPSHLNFVRESFTGEGRIGGPVGFLPGFNLFSGRLDLLTGAMHGHLHTDICAALAP
jgi:hypothetical protein